MKRAPKRKTYLLFRRYMSGICTVCVLVTIAGSLSADVSVPWITFRAFLVWGGIALLQAVLIKTWSAWETTNNSETPKSR